MVYHDAVGALQTTPLGFVLAKDNLLTIRFKPIRACDHRRFGAPNGDHPLPGGLGGFVALLDEIVDHLADELEALTGDLDKFSHIIFRDEDVRPRREAGGDSRDLRIVLRNIGRAGAFTSRISETLLGISRMIPYVTNGAADFLSAEVARQAQEPRAATSLRSTTTKSISPTRSSSCSTPRLGMINVDQNNIFKILTLVSVVGIPPTFIASMYGMNFKNMPELDWTYGYQYGLCLIVLSTIIPLVWFKWRGWW